MLMFRPFVRFAEFRGRASRSEYWLFVLLQSLVVGGCLGMAVASLNNPEDPGAALSGFLMWLGLYGLAGLVFILPWLAVLARRLHDIGQTAWWMLLLAPGVLWPFLVGQNMAGAIARTTSGVSDAAAGGAIVQAFAQGMLILLFAGACSLGLFVMTLLPGTRGPNRHGADPRDPDAAATDTPAGGLYDDARLDELFAQAKREREGEHRPAVDFGPGPQVAAPETGRAAWDSGVAPARPFGRRGA